MGLNWFIPALVKRRVGSFIGAHAELGCTVCWRSSKKETNVDRTLSVVQSSNDVDEDEDDDDDDDENNVMRFLLGKTVLVDV